jgi:hypothetical protein
LETVPLPAAESKDASLEDHFEGYFEDPAK